MNEHNIIFGLVEAKSSIYPLTKMGKCGIVLSLRFGRHVFAEAKEH
jgi:hypothetical protein